MTRTYWPHEEARRILARFPAASAHTLETGYGPSGAPHIGTFAEVARTTWVGRALEEISGKRWELVAFSDDMDGLRKVPLNMPAEALEPHLGRPLSRIPDPFGCHPSYGAHNNSLLRGMLDRFGLRYTFRSSHDQYTSGAFNEGLARIMRHYEEVRRVILPTIREEKRRDWSPFFPICERCGRINGTRVTSWDMKALTVTYVCEGEPSGPVGDEPEEEAGPGRAGCGLTGTVSILDGRCKVGWKVDWALRWHVLGVHYEMYGKDLIESAALSARVCEVISGKKGPVQSFYEMFLDEEGRKISKSVGKGLSVESWLAYAPRESLLLFIFREPRRAKRLSWDVVARSADEYLALLQRHYLEKENGPGEIAFVQPDLPPRCPYEYPVSYSMLLGLIVAIGVPAPEVVKGYVHHYKGALPGSDGMLEELIGLATAYVRDRIAPRRAPAALEPEDARLVRAFAEAIAGGAEEPTAEEIQSRAFAVARDGGMDPKRFFRVLYNVLTGQDSGPRLGPFVSLLGREKVAALLRERSG